MSTRRTLALPGGTEDADKNAPTGFPGILTEEESWKICPYDKSHRYLRDFVHLTKCRKQYVKEKKEKGEDVQISVCRYNWKHHVHEADIVQHEETCKDRYIIYAYLMDYKMRQIEKKLVEEIPEKDEKEADGDDEDEMTSDKEEGYDPVFYSTASSTATMWLASGSVE